MQGAKQLAQGKKGTGGATHQIGVRCPIDLYKWIESGKGPRETDTDRIIQAIELAKDVEDGAAARMPEIRAMALIENETPGRLLARLALESLDAKRKGKK